MHLIDPEAGVLGTVPLVGATISLAVGSALASKLQGDGKVTVSFFGDGAVEEGTFHESMNLAAHRKLPIVFVCENNFYSSHLHLDERRARDNIVEIGGAHGMPGERVDGNDVTEVYSAAAKAVDQARRGAGPTFLECRTYRWRGHVGASLDMDVGVKRKDELAEWLKRDPLVRTERALTSLGMDPAELETIRGAANEEVAEAIRVARGLPPPDPTELLSYVYQPPSPPPGAVSGLKVREPLASNPVDRELTYAEAIREAFAQLLRNDEKVFVIGQGLWSPWYVGSSMEDLDKEFGRERIVDSPVSENATTGAALGAGIAGMRPIVVHPRMDFMLLAADQITNQAANWSYMFGGRSGAGMVIRPIINRGGEQGAQHSQSVHSWFAHLPGMKVVMPSTPYDAKGLLISAVYDGNPVLYMDDRWLYSEKGHVPEDVYEVPIGQAVVRRLGEDLSIIANSYMSVQALQAASQLGEEGVSVEVIDLRTVKPMDAATVVESVKKTGRAIVADGGWASCGVSAEVAALICESEAVRSLKAPIKRVCLPPSPAPTATCLEKAYYPTSRDLVRAAKELLG